MGNMRKHAVKVKSQDEKVEKTNPLRDALASLKTVDNNYLTSQEVSKLDTIFKKLDDVVDAVYNRMSADLEKASVSEEEKMKKKALTEKLKNLSIEQIDNLLKEV